MKFSFPLSARGNTGRFLSSSQKGFTLVELLVVISVIGILAGLLLTNLVGVRGRAADVRLKGDLNQLKKALRLYYNDYQHYPAAAAGVIQGCGAGGASSCGTQFADSNTTYMKELPATYTYYSDGEEDFLLVVTLQNASDEDITSSLNRCDPASRAYYGQTPAATDYFVCED